MKKKRAESKKAPKSAKKDFLCSTATSEPCGFNRNNFNGNNVEFSTILEKDNKMTNEPAERKETKTKKKADNKKMSKLETIKMLSLKNNVRSTVPSSSKNLTIKINKLKEACQKKGAETDDHFENGADEDNNEEPMRKQSPPHTNLRSKKGASHPAILEVDTTEKSTSSTATSEPCGFNRNNFNGKNVEFSTILEKDNKMTNGTAERKETKTKKKADNRKMSKLEETIKMLSLKNNVSSTVPSSSKNLTIKINKLKEACQKKVAETDDHFENGADEDNNEEPMRKQSPPHTNLRSKKGALHPAILEVDTTEKSTKINKQREKKTKRNSGGPLSTLDDDATQNLTKINKESRNKETKIKSGGPSILDDTSPAVKRKRGRPKEITPQLIPAKPSSKKNEVINEDKNSDSAFDSFDETNSICGIAKSVEFIDTINDKGQIKRIRCDRGPLKYNRTKNGNWSCAISSISREKCSIFHFKIPPKKFKETCTLDRKYIMLLNVIYGCGRFINGNESIEIKEDSKVSVLGGSTFCIINNSDETMILNCVRTLKNKEI